MKNYLLLITGTDEVLSFFEWDEIASGSVTDYFLFPSGTYLTEVTSTYVLSSSVEPSSYIQPGNYAGTFNGSFYSTYYDEINVNDKFYVYTPLNVISGTYDSGSVNVELTGSLVITGSLIVTGSVILTGSFYGDYTGSLKGTASYAEYAKFAETGSQIEIIGKSKNWTPPTWAKKIKVVLVGGGGGGGFAPADEDGISPWAGAGGGAGGTVTFGEFNIKDLPSGSISVTIGAPGIGGNYDYTANEPIPATAGGNTIFGDYLIAPGGQPGISNDYTSGTSVFGGDSKGLINLLNTGGGPGGRGTCFIDAYDPSVAPQIPNHSVAPSLPIRSGYINVLSYQKYSFTWPMPTPASIAPTGGGGGLGYKPGDGRYGDGVDTFGGSILPYAIYPANQLNSVTPIEYNSSSYSHYPAFNTKIGLGGKGGNGYLLTGPTDGTDYGGGGGGAFAGGVTGSYTNGTPNGTQYNFGANGGRGVAIIISET